MPASSSKRPEFRRNWKSWPARCVLLSAALLASSLLCACPKKQWHYTPPQAPAPSRDFDAQWDPGKLDPNGAARNVDWQPQLQGRIPDPDGCNDGQPYTSACTQNTPFQDQPDGIHEAFCFFGKLGSGNVKPFFGHADWMVAQYDGSIGWFNFGDDFDYDLLLVPGLLPAGTGNEHGITKNNNYVADDKAKPQYIEMEFDSDETNPVFAKGWWKQFAASGQANDVTAIADLLHPGKETLACGSVVGLFGLDCDHGCRSELHPVYALAVQRTEDFNDNEWSVMVRNWGTGGYCSQYNDELAQTTMSLVLPYTSSQPPAQLDIQDFATAAASGSGVECPKAYFNNGQTILNLTMPPPQNKAEAAFTVKIQWLVGAQPVACTQVKSTEAAFMAREQAPRSGAPSRGEDYMGALLHGTNLAVRLDLNRDVLPAVPKNLARIQALPRPMLRAQPQSCDGPVPVTQGPPPPPAAIAVNKLTKDPVKQLRDDTIRSIICHKYRDQHLTPPVGTQQDLERACKAVK